MGIYTAAIQKLYVAYFNRPADTLGLGYWEGVVTAAGGSTAAVSAAFAASPEYAATYAGMRTAARVDAIYNNLFGRPAELAGLTYWGLAIDQGKVTVSAAVTAIAAGAQGSDLVAYNNKVTAATAFTAALDTTTEIVGYSGTTANKLAKVWMSAITTNASLTAATTQAALNASVEAVTSAGVSIYSLAASSVSANEGSTATFILSTTNVATGTQVAYTLSGVSAPDVQGGALTGIVTVGSNGQATISVTLLADSLTEGSETLTVTAGEKVASMEVNDTSITLSLQPPSVTTNNLSGITYIDALISEQRWSSKDLTTTLTYSFPWKDGKTATFSGSYNGADYSKTNEHLATQHFGLNNIQVSAAKLVLQNWSNVANINFLEVSENQNTVGDIRFAFSSAIDDLGFGAWAYYPDYFNQSGGDIWIAVGQAASGFSVGEYNFELLMHETGHSLGLKHPFEKESFNSNTLTEPDNNRKNTIMSFTDVGNIAVDVTQNGNIFSFISKSVRAETPMVYDIAVMQFLYGKNNKYMNGDNIYSFEKDTPFLKTIWDAGGTDTISVSNFTLACSINLQPGSYSTITILSDDTSGYSWTSPPPVATYDRTPNLGIAFDCVIENAVGGSGNDIIKGNDANNTITGSGGNDTLDGGAGIDIAVFTGSRSQYSISGSGTSRTVSDNVAGRDGRDTVSNFEFLKFSDQTISITLSSNYAAIASASPLSKSSTDAEKITTPNVPIFTEFVYKTAGISGVEIEGRSLNDTESTAYDKAPDEGVLSFWVSTLDKNVSLSDAATKFINSDEITGRYGSTLSNAAFVDALYLTVLLRGGDAEGVAHWSRMLAGKYQDRADVLLDLTQLPEFVGVSAANVTNGYWVV